MRANWLLVAITTLVLFHPAHLRAQEQVKTHPDLAATLGRLKTVVLLPPRITMYEIGAGGTPERMEEWETAAHTNIRHAFSAHPAFSSRFRLTTLDEEALAPAIRDTYDETRLLYEAVGESILLHTDNDNPPSLFPEKSRAFLYSLGSEVQQVAPEIDALLIVEGFDHRSSAGRKVIQAGTTLIALLFGAIVIPQGGGNMVTVALVEAKTGNILWFYRSRYSYDLRDASSAAAFVDDALMQLLVPGQ